MDSIKKTIILNEKTQRPNIIWWNYHPSTNKAVKFKSLEVVSIQLFEIDPTDIALEYRMVFDGKPIQTAKEIYLGHYGGDFVSRENYLEFYPKGNSVFTILSTDDCNCFELIAKSVNHDITNQKFT